MYAIPSCTHAVAFTRPLSGVFPRECHVSCWALYNHKSLRYTLLQSLPPKMYALSFITKPVAAARGDGIGVQTVTSYCISGCGTSHATNAHTTMLNIQYLAGIILLLSFSSSTQNPYPNNSFSPQGWLPTLLEYHETESFPRTTNMHGQ